MRLQYRLSVADHQRQPNGTYTHAAFLAEGPEDARPPLAEAMVRATANAERVVTYTSFEKTRIRELQRAVPELAAELAALEAKLIDLYPVVKNCVYHLDFRGSFSLKDILTPLVPELTYNDLVIVDGRVASVEIARLPRSWRTRSLATSAIAYGRTSSSTASAIRGRWSSWWSACGSWRRDQSGRGLLESAP